MCNNRPTAPHRIHLVPSHNSHPRGNGQRNLGRLTPCLVANSPESEGEKESGGRRGPFQRWRRWLAQVFFLASSIQRGRGHQERQGRPFMRLHKSSQEPPHAFPPARGFTESNIFAGTAREEGRGPRRAGEVPRRPRDSRPALAASAAAAAAAAEFPRKSLQ